VNSADPIRLHRTIAASPEHVYRAWVDPICCGTGLHPAVSRLTQADVDDRVGGRYRIWQANANGDAGGLECEFLEVAPSERIVFRWGFVGPDRLTGPIYDSVLTITLAEEARGNTVLTLSREHLEALRAALPEVADNVKSGWDVALDKVEQTIEMLRTTEQ
jgi:uncharacterized protein YndB with AHSA1/START domain